MISLSHETANNERQPKLRPRLQPYLNSQKRAAVFGQKKYVRRNGFFPTIQKKKTVKFPFPTKLHLPATMQKELGLQKKKGRETFLGRRPKCYQ